MTAFARRMAKLEDLARAAERQREIARLIQTYDLTADEATAAIDQAHAFGARMELLGITAPEACTRLMDEEITDALISELQITREEASALVEQVKGQTDRVNPESNNA